MREPPNYPDLPIVKIINWKRWLQRLFIFLAMTLLITNIFWPDGKSIKTPLFWAISLIFPSIIYAFVFSIYFFINRLTLYNRDINLKIISEDEKKWWAYYSAFIPIEDVIIIGCLGNKQNDWSMLLRNKLVPPPPENENGKLILRCPLLIGNKKNRDEILAKLLANEFSTRLEENELSIEYIYWIGTAYSMDIFTHCLQENKKISIKKIMPIHSINDLDTIIDHYHEKLGNNGYMLIAGTNLYDEEFFPPQSESAFAWLVGHTGKYAIHRCEIIDESIETLSKLTTQLEKYASLTKPPKVSIAMDNKSAIAFSLTNWSCSEHNLAPYYGGVTRSSPFLAISQAAIHCLENNVDSCGWVSHLSDQQYIAGVINQHE